MIADVATYMRILLFIDKVNEVNERRVSIGVCRMYADIWQKEWLKRRVRANPTKE
jgi:hypothetical protein